MALLVSFYLLLHSATTAGPLEALEPFVPGAYNASVFVIQPFLAPLTILIFAVFPDGRFVPSWTRWVFVLSCIAMVIVAASYPIFGFFDPAAAQGPLLIFSLLGAIAVGVSLLYAQVYRYRNISTPEQQQQTKWVIYGTAVWFLLTGLSAGPFMIVQMLPPGSVLPGWAIFLSPVWIIATAAFPVSLAFAVLRYRLWDIDLVINRTLVYGTLTAGVVAFYALVVGMTSFALQSGGQLAVVFLATAGIVLVLKPLRGLIQRAVNRLLYRDRATITLAGGASKLLARDDQGSSNDSPLLVAPLWRVVLNVAWYACAALAVLILVASLPAYLLMGESRPAEGRLAPNPAPELMGLTVVSALFSFGTALLCLALAGLLFRKRSHERMGLFLSFYLLAHGILLAGPIELLEYIVPGIAMLNSFLLLPLIHIPVSIALFAVFPDGRFVPPWTRRLVLAALLFAPFAYLYVNSIGFSINPNDPLVISLTAFAVLTWLAIWVSVLYAQVYRYRHVSTRRQRLQAKWVIYGLGIWLATQGLSVIPWIYSFSLPRGTMYPVWLAAASTLWALSNAVLPVTLTLAVMRYRLYQVDLVINRTLVYGALTAMILLLYVLAVSVLGALFHSGENLLVSLLATGLAAILFQPLRDRLQRGVNRLMYGERDAPHAVLSRLGKRLESSLSPDATFRTIVETVGQALKLPYVAIALKQDTEMPDRFAAGPDPTGDAVHELTVVESFGTPVDEVLRFPLVYQSEMIGQLQLAPRSAGESFTAEEFGLLEDIAYQTGVIAHNVRLADALGALAADLQKSRERLVVAREEERRRLRRDLHDGLGPLLASQTLTLDALGKAQTNDPTRAMTLLRDLKAQSHTAVNDIRRLVYDLRPPALDDFGLVGALRESIEQIRSSGVRFDFDAPSELPPLPAAVEVAAYRIGQEAITNVVRHSGAQSCRVRLQPMENGLEVGVLDDGRGLPARRNAGIGLHSMRERATELGGWCKVETGPRGGTQVLAWLPIHEFEPAPLAPGPDHAARGKT
jgi:signal transduction histidine kinase